MDRAAQRKRKRNGLRLHSMLVSYAMGKRDRRAYGKPGSVAHDFQSIIAKGDDNVLGTITELENVLKDAGIKYKPFPHA